MGNELLNEVTEATGLPEDLIGDELSRLIRQAELDPQSITLDQLRIILASYLQDVFVEAKDHFDKKSS